jgi:hypothetical protein
MYGYFMTISGIPVCLFGYYFIWDNLKLNKIFIKASDFFIPNPIKCLFTSPLSSLIAVDN